MAKMGRPSKYTPATVERILSAIRSGATRQIAASCGGINEDTLYVWLKTYPEFSEQIQMVEAETAEKFLKSVQSAAKKNWKAAAWWLERKLPEQFARKPIERAVNIQVTTDDLSKMTDEQIDDLIKRFDPSAR
jgi:hypothetical protein